MIAYVILLDLKSSYYILIEFYIFIQVKREKLRARNITYRKIGG